jgi:hypothetical protein
MSQYGATHELVVEYIYQGAEPDTHDPNPRAVAHEWSVFYIVRHPEDCWPDWRAAHGEKGDACPIDQQVEEVGFDDAFGMRHWRDGRSVLEHLPEGLYRVNAWLQQYSGPEGTDWDGGLEIEPVEAPPTPKPPKPTLTLLPKEET